MEKYLIGKTNKNRLNTSREKNILKKNNFNSNLNTKRGSLDKYNLAACK